MRAQSAVMQRALWMLCVPACPASEKLHVCKTQSHGMGVLPALCLLEIKYTPTKSHVQTTGARGSAGPAHTTAATFLPKIFRFVVAGAVVMSGHSCIHEHCKLIFCCPANQ